MNIFTVRKASLGFGLYIIKMFGEEGKKRGVVLSHDNRFYSRDFVLESSKLFNELGINTFIFESLRPTPELSYAVRETHAIAGVMVTASHNPKEYNGYKVYDEEGCQLIPSKADVLLGIINNLGDELDVTYEVSENKGHEVILGEDMDTSFLKAAEGIALRKDEPKNIKIVFSPQHGTSSYVGQRLFKELGYEMYPVKEQCVNDPSFGATLSPNPENKEAYVKLIELAKEKKADLILTTDPDADRVGVGFLNSKGEYELHTGNQTGALLINYVLGTRKELGLLSKESTLCDTIVTSKLGEKIAESYGVQHESFLTGFKFIGDAIYRYSKEEPMKHHYEFGYEESYGYLIEPYARDKDSLQALVMVSEMANYYLNRGKRLDEVLDDIYKKFGYHCNKLFNIYFEGKSGSEDMNRMLDNLRKNPLTVVNNTKVVAYEDYLRQVRVENGVETKLDHLPKSNVLKYYLEDGSWFATRPSGTEPKCKFYYEAVDRVKENAQDKPQKLHDDVCKILGL